MEFSLCYTRYLRVATQEGRTYYAHAESRTTQWELPDANQFPVSPLDIMFFDSRNHNKVFLAKAGGMRTLKRLRKVSNFIMEFLANNTRYVQDINLTSTIYHVLGTVSVTDQAEQPGTWQYQIFTNQKQGLHLVTDRRLITPFMQQVFTQAKQFALETPATKQLFAMTTDDYYSYVVLFYLTP